MNALILVDIQNDFVEGGALEVSGGKSIIALANELQNHFDLVVATQDWHPENHKSFAANHEGKSVGTMITLDGLSQILWATHCVQNSFGAEFVATLETEKITKVFRKGTNPNIDSYSGFFDNGHKKATGLGDYMKSKKVTDVYVLGLATDYCVKFTALDAQKLGFKTHFIQDVSKGVEISEGDIANAIQEMKTANIQIIESSSILNQ